MTYTSCIRLTLVEYEQQEALGLVNNEIIERILQRNERLFVVQRLQHVPAAQYELISYVASTSNDTIFEWA